MAGEDDDVIVSLPGDTSQVVKTDDVVVKTGAAEVSFNDEDGGDPVADLKKQFTQMTGALSTVVASQQQTEQQLREANQRLQRAESQVTVSQLETIENGIAQIDADTEAAEAAYAHAFDAGDGAAMARANRAMQQAIVNRAKLVEAHQDLKEAAKRGPAQQQGRQPVRTAPADPVEAVIANGNVSPKSAAWLRAHPQCITDPKLNARMLAAHNLALADDIPVDSDEYFERIEQGIKPVKQQQQQVEKKPAADGRRPSSAAAAGGATGGGLNGGTVQVKLTKGEAASATDGTLVWNWDDPGGKFKKGEPIGLAEMARRKHEGMKAGLYDRNNVEV
jgi:hypothetical protein